MSRNIKKHSSKSLRTNYIKSLGRSVFHHDIENYSCVLIEDFNEYINFPIYPVKTDHVIFFYITKGTLNASIGFRACEVKSSQILLLKPGEVFSAKDISTETKGFVSHFHPDIILGDSGTALKTIDEQLFSINAPSIYEIPEDNRTAITNLHKRIYKEYRSDSPNISIMRAYFNTILTELQLQKSIEIKEEFSAATKITRTFFELVKKNIYKSVNLAQYAEMLNISPNHLNKCVKQHTGESAQAYIDRLKLIEIKYQLYQTELSISCIADKLGFYDISYFSRFFKKHEGMSPREFRKKIE